MMVKDNVPIKIPSQKLEIHEVYSSIRIDFNVWNIFLTLSRFQVLREVHGGTWYFYKSAGKKEGIGTLTPGQWNFLYDLCLDCGE